MTKLEAVNYLLGILGTAPVGSLSNTNPDVSTCETALDEALVSVCSKGFWFNTIYSVALTPDPVTSQIDLAGYYKVISRNPQYAILVNGKLFDPINNTYEFSNTVYVDAVKTLTFVELPDSVQEAVKYFAGVQLCITDLEDDAKEMKVETLYNNAYRQVKMEDLEIKRRNLKASPRTADALHRVAPARLGRRYGPNFGGRGY